MFYLICITGDSLYLFIVKIIFIMAVFDFMELSLGLRVRLNEVGHKNSRSRRNAKCIGGAGAAGLVGLPAAVGFGGIGLVAGGGAAGIGAAGVAGAGGALGGLVGNLIKDFLWLPYRGLEGVLINSKKSRLNGKKMWEIAWDIEGQPKDERKTSWHSPEEFDLPVEVSG